MNRKISEYIKLTREDLNLTQEYVADKIDVSRPTYVQIEKGERELTVSEAQDLADLFHISMGELLSAKTEAVTEVVFEKSSKQKSHAPDVRICIPQKNLKKFKEVLLYILEKVGAKPNIGETAIYKLMYFIDFDYYEKFEEQLIGATYIKNHFGPTPIEFKKVVNDMEEKGEVEQVKSSYFQYEQKKYLPRRNPDLSILNARELTLIDDVLARLSDKSAKELSDYSHEDIPWKVHKQGEKISYESVFYRDHEHSVKSYDDEL